MSSSNPPYPYYYGIPYNPAFFTSTSTSSGTGLTQTLANTLYLQKTTTDNDPYLATFSGGIALGTLSTIKCGTPVADSAVYNTITNFASNQTVALTTLGSTYFLYNNANSGFIPQTTNTVFNSMTVSNTGIYTVCYHARYSGISGRPYAQSVSTWIYVSSPSLYGSGGLGQLALTLLGYTSSYLDLAFVGASTTGSWTGLINAGASVQLIGYIQYNTTPFTGILLGGSSSNYLSITRIG